MWEVLFSIVLICEAILTFFFVRSFIKSKKANSETVGYFISILILGYIIYLIPFFYEQIVIHSEGNILIGLLSCLFSAIKMFAFDYLTDSMKSFISIYPFYSIVFTFGSLLAMFTTILTTISLFYVNLINHYRLKKRLNNENNIVVFGIGKTEMDYLEKNDNKVIWPFKKLKKEEFIELVDNGYAIITEPISYESLTSKMFKDKNLYQFYHLTENEDEEVMLIEIFKKINSESSNKEKKYLHDFVNNGNNKFLHLNMSQIKVEVFKRKINQYGITNINIFSINEKLIQNLLFDLPLTSKLPEGFIDYNYGIINPEKIINVFIVGYDEINEQLLPELIAANQLVTIKDNKFAAYKVNYIIIDNYINESDIKHINHINSLKRKILENHSEYFELFEDIGNVYLYKFDVNSTELVDLVSQYINNKDSFNYFYISFGNKYKNIIISDTLRNELNEFDNVHFVINSGKKDLVGEINKDSKLSYYGDYKDIIETNEFSSNKIVDLAMSFVQEDWNSLSIINRDNKISLTLSLQLKLNMLGLKLVEHDKVTDKDQVIGFKEYRDLTSNYCFDEWGYDNSYDYNAISKENALLYQEHLRHCAKRLLTGFEPKRLSDITYDRHDNVITKDFYKKEDLFITTYYELENVSKFLAKKDKKSFKSYEELVENFEIRKYDMYFLQSLYQRIIASDYEVIKK